MMLVFYFVMFLLINNVSSSKCLFEARNLDGSPLTNKQNVTYEKLKKDCDTKTTNHCFVYLDANNYPYGQWLEGCVWNTSEYGQYCTNMNIYNTDGCKRLFTNLEIYLCCCRGHHCNTEQYLLRSPVYTNASMVTSSTAQTIPTTTNAMSSSPSSTTLEETTTSTPIRTIYTSTTSRPRTTEETTTFVTTTETKSFPIWIVFVILGVLLLIVITVIIVVLLVRRHRKKIKKSESPALQQGPPPAVAPIPEGSTLSGIDANVDSTTKYDSTTPDVEVKPMAVKSGKVKDKEESSSEIE